jgi:hypothetical protein
VLVLERIATGRAELDGLEMPYRVRLRAQIASIEVRLARPLGAKANKREGLARGYASRCEWHAKSRRLQVLKDRLAVVEADWSAGRVRVVRGGKRLAHARKARSG